MRLAVSFLIALASLLATAGLGASAQTADVEATITDVNTSKATIKLDDGKTYQAPGEFDYSGLEKGVKVTVSYTVVDGKRVIDDLEVVQ